MSDKYKNNKGLFIETHTDRRGKDHVSFYDRDPEQSDHETIHINWDSSTGKGNVVESDDSGKTTTDFSCFLTSACMKHFQENFDDNCYELRVLRWFRDNFVSKGDVIHYYEVAPIIVTAIDSEEKNEIVYDYIYENVVDACVEAIEKGDYIFAYNRYKSSILSLETTFIKKEKQKVLMKV